MTEFVTETQVGPINTQQYAVNGLDDNYIKDHLIPTERQAGITAFSENKREKIYRAALKMKIVAKLRRLCSTLQSRMLKNLKPLHYSLINDKIVMSNGLPHSSNAVDDSRHLI